MSENNGTDNSNKNKIKANAVDTGMGMIFGLVGGAVVGFITSLNFSMCLAFGVLIGGALTGLFGFVKRKVK